MILDCKNGIRKGITRAISCYAETNNKYCMTMMKQKKVHTLNVLILTINTDRLSQPTPYEGLDYIENIPIFTHNFINYSKNSGFGYTY